MEKRIYKSELLDILRQGYPDIPHDVDLDVSHDGIVTVWCRGFMQPDWLHGNFYMNSDATIEIYELGSEYEWEYIPADRAQIIRALLQFDEGVYGYDFTFDSTDDLYDKLVDVAEEKGFTAMDLIIAVDEGF